MDEVSSEKTVAFEFCVVSHYPNRGKVNSWMRLVLKTVALEFCVVLHDPNTRKVNSWVM